MTLKEREEPLKTQLLTRTPLLRRPDVRSLVTVALLAEIGYAVMNLSAMGPYLQFDRGMGVDIYGVVVAAFLLSEALFKSPMGHLADRYGRRLFMTIGPLLSIGTAVVTIFLPHNLGALEVLVFVLLRVIDGMGLAMIQPAVYATMSDLVTPDERQEGLSYLNLCYLMGVALAMPIGGAINDATHHKTASFWLSAFMFACVSFAAYRLKSLGPANRDRAPKESSGEEGFGFSELKKAAKRNPIYVGLAFLTFMGVGAPMPIFKVFPMLEFHLTETQVGFLVFPVVIAMMLANGFVSKMGQKIGRARSVHWGIGLCALGMATLASGMVLPFMRNIPVVTLSLVPVGIGFLLAIPAWYASVSDLDPENRGINIGLIMTGQGLGAITGDLAGGFLSKHLEPVGDRLGLGATFGNYMPFACSCLFITIGWVLSLRVLKDEGPNPPALPSEPAVQ